MANVLEIIEEKKKKHSNFVILYFFRIFETPLKKLFLSFKFFDVNCDSNFLTVPSRVNFHENKLFVENFVFSI